MRSSYSKDSDGFTAPGVVAENVRAYNLRVSTAGDAGGVVVWDDNTDEGKVFAAPIPVGGVVPDTDPPSAAADQRRRVQAAEEHQEVHHLGDDQAGRGRGGPGWRLLRRGAEGRQDADHLDDRRRRQRQRHQVRRHEVLDQGHRRHEEPHDQRTAGVVQSAGPIIFSKDAGTWDVDGKTTFEGLEKFGIKLFDFKALGQATVTVRRTARPRSTANLALPRPFDIVTGGTTLTTTTAKGLSLVGIKIGVPSLSVGVFEMRDLSVTYDASSSSFTGHVDLEAPARAASTPTSTVGFRKGKLVRLSLDVRRAAVPVHHLSRALDQRAPASTTTAPTGSLLGGGAELGVPTIGAGRSPSTRSAARRAPVAASASPSPTSGPARLDLAGTLEALRLRPGERARPLHPGRRRSSASTARRHRLPAARCPRRCPRRRRPHRGHVLREASLEGCVFVCVDGQAVISNIGVAACIKIDLFVTDARAAGRATSGRAA